ncbi:hypothetical protein M2T79_12500 [Elizabethkingia miricola]|uniref:hypothetical protein n=1 Tax=Elizabethkingia miricola TaxID=172045 RepID=UPI0020189281|nr:hypothetical protein [Elizabethkingia miricola]MCL1657417.1 hypothetical protein [Elizabethkingia miricola]
MKEHYAKLLGLVLSDPNNRFTVASEINLTDLHRWLNEPEEVPDHSEEMLSLLEEVNKIDKSMFSDKFNTDDFKRKLNRLINKVKDNGK